MEVDDSEDLDSHDIDSHDTDSHDKSGIEVVSTEDFEARLAELERQNVELANRNREQAEFIERVRQAQHGRPDAMLSSASFDQRDDKSENIQGNDRPHERDLAPSERDLRILSGDALGPTDRLIIDTKNLALRQSWKVRVTLEDHLRARCSADVYEVAFHQGRAHVPAVIAEQLLQQPRYRIVN